MNQLFQNTFFKSFAVLAGGTLVAQIILLGSYPFVTRLFTPEDFGVKAFFTMVLTLAATVSTGKYEEAVTIPKEDQKAVDVVAASFFVSVLSAIFFAIFFFFFYKKIVEHPTEYDFWIYVILLPIGIITINVVNILSHWAIRKSDFKIQSKVRVIQSISKATFELTGGLLKMGSVILVIGTVIGMAGGVIRYSRYFFQKIKELGLEFRRSFSRERRNAVFRRFIDFPKFFVLVELFHKLTNILPILFLTGYSTTEMLGHYSIAALAVTIPNGILMGALLNVFYAEISQKLKLKSMDTMAFFLKYSGVILLVSLILGIGFYLLGKPFLLYVFGNQWEIAGDILKNYGWVILGFSGTYISHYVFKLLEKQKEFLYLNIIKFIILCIGFYISNKIGHNEKESIWVYVIVLILTTSFQWLSAFWNLKKIDKN